MGKKLSIFMALCLAISITSCQNTKKTNISYNTTDVTEVLSSDSDAQVQTTAGKIAGYVENDLYIFKGIPYAQAERFMPPTPPDPWDGIRSCRYYGPTCPQGVRTGWQSDNQAFAFDWDDGYPGEDCQRINIWTPSINNGKRLPVMVWLHGGGYYAGSGNELPSYDGSNLAKKGEVVVVSLNHRLNILGFLDLSAYGKIYEQSGNVGLIDIICALQWVHDNISSFGGDPSNVTIFGQSGGGSKVSNLMAAPAARGLFHKAIVQSGSSIKSHNQEFTRALGVAVMEELGIKSSEIEKLKTIPYQQLLAAGNTAMQKINEAKRSAGEDVTMRSWGPVVDGLTLTAHPFYPQAPEMTKNVPMLIGTTINEFMMGNYIPGAKEMNEEQIKNVLYTMMGEKTEAYVTEFKNTYPDAKPIDLLDIDTRFRKMAVNQADIKYAQKGADVYMYLFTWESPVLNGMLGSMHCMELPFVFNNIERCSHMTGGGADAHALASKMSDAWIAFAKTGNPNTESLPEWEPYTTDKGATMFFGNDCKVKYNHDRNLLNILNN